MTPTLPSPSRLARFRAAYAAHRDAEGRRADPDTLLRLPYVRRGPFAREWAVRARTFEAFLRHVIDSPRGGAARRILDLGAGAGWLSYRLARAGHAPTALDWRCDRVDGLGAAGAFRSRLDRLFARVGASFDALPLRDRAFDVVAFNAAIHYAEDLTRVLAEAARVTRPDGVIAILDSPFYARPEDGERMAAEKRRDGARRFGDHAADLLALRAVEFLTAARLAGASAGLGLTWHRHRVRYPLWYEIRPVLATLRGRRPPSRFDLWTATVP